MKFTDAMVAKMTVKKILSLLDHIEMIIAHGLGDGSLKLTIHDWFDELRLHLRKVEFCVETAAE